MSKSKISISGIYPKLSKEENTPNLKQNLHKFDEGEISKEDLNEIVKQNISNAISEMRNSGVQVFNDALIRWTDFFSPFSQNFEGIAPGVLKRIFDTNTLQRKPKISGKIKFSQNEAITDLKFAKSLLSDGEKIKATIPGPFTFLDSCENDYYEKEEELLKDLTKSLNQQLREYEKAGADFIEIYDPILSFEKKENLEEIYEILKTEINIPIIIGCFYGTLLEENLNQIKNLLDGFSLDLINTPEMKNIPEFKIIQLGIFNARATAKDNIEKGKIELEEIKNKFPNSEIWLCLNNSPEFLPRGKAQEKISELKKLLT